MAILYEKHDGYVLKKELGMFGKKEKISYEQYYHECPDTSGFTKQDTPSEANHEEPIHSSSFISAKVKGSFIEKNSENHANSFPQQMLVSNLSLAAIDPNDIQAEDKDDIDAAVMRMIQRYKYNRQDINRLVFESVSAMTMGEDYERELARKKGLRQFVGNITGSNKKLQDKINHNRAIAQYAAQQTIQRLAEQNLMTFDLITAVNSKLNSSVLAIEEEINQVYSVLTKFFKQYRSNMLQLETRVEGLERNVSLLNWQNSIEYQLFDGVEYSELDSTAKIICITKDFFEITKGNWTTTDLLLLKTAMSTIGLSPKSSVRPWKFLHDLWNRPRLLHYLTDGKIITGHPSPNYLPMIVGIQKRGLLAQGEERYIAQSVFDLLQENHVNYSEDQIYEMLVQQYLQDEGDFNVMAEIDCYDFIVSLIFQITQANQEGVLLPDNSILAGADEENLDELYQTASSLFKDCKLEEAYPLLLDLSERGYARANALLYWLQLDGCKSSPYNTQIAKDYAKRGYHAGDAICTLQYALFCCESKDERIELCRKYIPHLRALADSGDVFAEYMMGICRLNETDEPTDYFAALQWFLDASSKNFYRAFYGMALRYYRGEGVEKSIDTAQLWLLKATEFKEYAAAYNLLGDIYIEEFQEYSDGYDLYMHAATLENGEAYKNLGVMYNMGWGVAQDLNKAESYYERAAKLGNSGGQYYLGQLYLEGQGHPQDLKIAKYWIELAANQGHLEAIKLLKERLSN